MLDLLARDGGPPVRVEPYPPWPAPPSPATEQRVLEVLRSGEWGSNVGKVGLDLADRFAHRHGAAHGLGVANATLGLFAALKALDVGPGDEVVVPGYTFIATATAVVLTGARVVVADVDPDTLLISTASVADCLSERTRAVIPVHLAGAVADIPALRTAVGPHIGIVEDAAQAHGAAWEGRPVGSLGDLGCFSFQSSKTMTAGEGGMITTDDDRLFGAAFAAVNVGRVPDGGWYEHRSIGWNMRMTEMQSALLLEQLAGLDAANDECARHASLLTSLLEDVPGVTPAAVPEGVTTHGWHLYAMHLDLDAFGGAPKSEVVAAIAAEGVPVSAGYVPLHRNEALLRAADRPGGRPLAPHPCPGTDRAAERSVWLPRPVLSDGEAGVRDAARAIAKVQAALAANPS